MTTRRTRLGPPPDTLPLWRRREILAGRLASEPFDPVLYEQFGVVLMAMHDEPEAGRFLLFAPNPQPYRVAIDLFVHRHGGGEWRTLASQLPNSAKREPFAALPTRVQEVLREAGYPTQLEPLSLRQALGKPDPVRVGRNNWGCLVAVGASLVFLGVLVRGCAS